VEEFIHGYNTCFSESLHRQRMVWAPKEMDFFKSFKGRCYLTVCINHLGSNAMLAITEELEVEMTATMQQKILAMTGEDVKNKQRWRSERVRRRWAQRKKERTARRTEERAASRAQKEAYDFGHTLFSEAELKANPISSKKQKKTPANWGPATKGGAKWKCATCGYEFAPGTSKSKHKLRCGKGRARPRGRPQQAS
jgi:hypothetical protein